MYNRIDISQCRAADIIVTTGNGAASIAIRNGTRSSVSHAILYLGSNLVLESVASGVEQRSWDISKTIDGEVTLAIALRRKNMSPSDCDKVVEAALQYKGKPYDTIGAIGSGMFGNRSGGVIAGVGAAAGCMISPTACQAEIQLRQQIIENAKDENADNAFFCSELVARAFTAAGFPIVNGRATDQTPRAIRTSSYLEYVGHLIDTPPKSNNLTPEQYERNSRSGYRKG